MQNALTPLQQEILNTLTWFADSDIAQLGHITESTLLCFQTQEMQVPEVYKKFILKDSETL